MTLFILTSVCSSEKQGDTSCPSRVSGYHERESIFVLLSVVVFPVITEDRASLGCLVKQRQLRGDRIYYEPDFVDHTYLW